MRSPTVVGLTQQPTTTNSGKAPGKAEIRRENLKSVEPRRGASHSVRCQKYSGCVSGERRGKYSGWFACVWRMFESRREIKGRGIGHGWMLNIYLLSDPQLDIADL